MESFLAEYFEYENSLKLTQGLNIFVGRPRHFFEFYLSKVEAKMREIKPQTKQEMTDLLIEAIDPAQSSLVERFRTIVDKQYKVGISLIYFVDLNLGYQFLSKLSYVSTLIGQAIS